FDQIERAEAAAIQARDVLNPGRAAQIAETPAPRKPEKDGRDIAADGTDLNYWNGYGGFDGDGRHYVVRLTGRRSTPQPWINVIANEAFGFH
ncbi:hypothetical protein, partial [Klebsiella pneumoniae]